MIAYIKSLIRRFKVWRWKRQGLTVREIRIRLVKGG